MNPVPFSLQMDGIEVVQAIQDMAQSVTLIIGKQTVVRLYLSYYASPDIQVQGELSAYHPGTAKSYFVASANQPILSATNAGNMQPKRLDASLSLNFILPPQVIAVAGAWIFSLSSLINVATGTPLSVVQASTKTGTFVTGAPLRARVLGIRYSTGTPPVQHVPSDQDYNLLFSWLGRAYPTAQVIGSRALIDISPSAPAMFGSGDVNAQLAAIRALDVAAGADKRTHYYGMVSDAGFFMRGSAAGIPATPDPSTVASGPTGSATWGWDFDGSYGDWYGGHELGHTFGRFHPGSGCGESSDDPNFPYPKGQLAASDTSFCGFDVGDPTFGIAPRAMPGTVWHDVMTYCQWLWLSAYTYEGIRTRLLAEDALPAGPVLAGGGSAGGPPDRRFPEGAPQDITGKLINVVARVNLTKREGQILFVHPVATGRADVGPSYSPALLRLKSAGGQILNEYRIPIKIDSCVDENSDQTGLVDAIVSTSPDARQVELLIEGHSVDTFQAKGPGPAESLRDLRRTESPAGPGLSWHGAEGLTYAVQASTDEGTSWFTVAVGLKTPEFRFDPRQFPGARRVQIRVLATDGFTQTVMPPESFDIPQ
jgi:hypothetical protein